MDQQLKDTFIQIAEHIKELRARVGNKSELMTIDKSSTVKAINELWALIDAIENVDVIDDTLADGLNNTYSITKIRAVIQEASDALVDGAPIGLNTLNKIASALNAVKLLAEASVLYDEQSLDETEKAQARVNIGAVSQSDLDALRTELINTLGLSISKTAYDQDIIGLRNGENNTFVLAEEEIYIPGSLIVFLDGQRLSKGNNYDYTEFRAGLSGNGAVINRVIGPENVLIFEYKVNV